MEDQLINTALNVHPWSMTAFGLLVVGLAIGLGYFVRQNQKIHKNYHCELKELLERNDKLLEKAISVMADVVARLEDTKDMHDHIKDIRRELQLLNENIKQ